MSDGHLYLGEDGVAVAAEPRSVWVDHAHVSLLVLPATTRRVLEVSLLPAHERQAPKRSAIARAKSAPVLPMDAARAPAREYEEGNRQVTLLYDFSTFTASIEAPVTLLRLSLDREFLAIQKSDVEVQVVRLATRESFWIVCKPKAGNRILSDGVLWNVHATTPQSSQDLFLVTRMGIEQYRVSPKRRSCALHRTIGVYVHAFWYSAPHSVLFVSTGSRANEIVPFLMQGVNVEKLPRLVFSSAVRKRDLYLASLYGELYAVYGDSKSTRLLLYRVAKDKVACVRSLHIMLPAGSQIEFSVVDNLLVCHSVEFNVSLFFDIKCESNVHDPFSHPLPVSLEPPVTQNIQNGENAHSLIKMKSFIDPRSAGTNEVGLLSLPPHGVLPSAVPQQDNNIMRQASAQMNHHDHASSEGDSVDVSPWRFVPPDLVQRTVSPKDARTTDENSGHVEFRRFHLNLELVCRSSAQHPEILGFLLRRGNTDRAKSLALAIVRERLEEQQMVPAMASALIADVQTVSRRDTDRRGMSVGTTASDDSANDTSSDDELQYRYGAGAAVVPLSIRKRFLRGGVGDLSVDSSSRMPLRNADGLALVTQTDFWHHVWKPLLVGTSHAACTYLVEFIRLLCGSQVPVENITYVALAKAFIGSGRTRDLYQVIHYHAVEDSIELANVLLDGAASDAGLRQLALDMFSRLGWFGSVVRALLIDGEVEEAMVVAWRHAKPDVCDSSVIPASVFFDACVTSLTTRNRTSALVSQQKLHSLLTFLRLWDPGCLVGVPSPLALSSKERLPDELMPKSSTKHWRRRFGFPMD